LVILGSDKEIESTGRTLLWRSYRI